MAAASAPGMTEPTQPKLVPNRMARTTRSPAARLRRRLYMGYPRSGRDRYTAVARAQKEKTPQRGRSGAPSRRPFSGCRCRHDSMALPGLEPGRGVAPLDFESSASTVPPEGPISKYPTRKIICVHRASSISIGQTWGRRSIVTNALPGEDRNAKAADELFAGRGPARRDGARPQASERSHCASHRGYGGRADRPGDPGRDGGYARQARRPCRRRCPAAPAVAAVRDHALDRRSPGTARAEVRDRDDGWPRHEEEDRREVRRGRGLRAREAAPQDEVASSCGVGAPRFRREPAPHGRQAGL